MELNTRGRYAVMAMADLAKNHGDGPIALTAIADRQQISIAYLEQIFQRLRQSGLVESMRGRSGGYRLAAPAREITIAQIMQAADEPVEMTRCANEGGVGCVGHERCLTHDLWKALGTQISDFLEGVSLEDVLRREGLLARDGGGSREQGSSPQAFDSKAFGLAAE